MSIVPDLTATDLTATGLSGTDAELVAACAAIVDVPKAAPPDSFVLHAPLELLARALLLPLVPEPVRPLARQRLRWLADRYQAAGPPAQAAGPRAQEAGSLAQAAGPPAHPAGPVVQAAGSEPASPDVAAPARPTADAAPPVDEMLVSLAAAGHAPILLALRPRVAAVPATFGDRLVAGELARHPGWRLTWPGQRRADGPRSHDLEDRLAAPRSPGDPGSSFIYPTMHLVDASGLAAEVLDEPLRGLSVDEARTILLRVAARSMLQDDPAAAPYGWTHCLTMPQAVLALAVAGSGSGGAGSGIADLDLDLDLDPGAADPDLAVAVAATYVLGFRATQGRVALDPDWSPGSGGAVHRVWHADDEELAAISTGLAAFGAVHPDAHVAKYTLAGLDAATADPEAARLHLAAVAHLHTWWRDAGPGDDPILNGFLNGFLDRQSD